MTMAWGASATVAGHREFRRVDFMSRTIDNGSVRFKEKMTSKAFRATLHGLRDDQLRHLRGWADRHCAQSVVFTDERGAAVLLALKDQWQR